MRISIHYNKESEGKRLRHRHRADALFEPFFPFSALNINGFPSKRGSSRRCEKYGALTTRISKVLNYSFGPRFCHPSNDDGRGDSSIQIYPRVKKVEISSLPAE